MEISDLNQAENFVNLKDSQISLMKINSVFSYVEPEELLRNNSGVSWRSNDGGLQMTIQKELP